MFELTLILLYLFTIQFTKEEIKKKYKLTLSRLKQDGYIIEERKKIKFFYTLLLTVPMLNLFTVSFFKDNFEDAYQEFKNFFIQKEMISKSPLLKEIDRELKKLPDHEYQIIKRNNIINKVQHIEKARNIKLFENLENIISMNVDEQNSYIRIIKEEQELKKFINNNINSAATSNEKIIYFNNLRKLFESKNSDEKIKKL